MTIDLSGMKLLITIFACILAGTGLTLNVGMMFGKNLIENNLTMWIIIVIVTIVFVGLVICIEIDCRGEK